MKCMLILGFCCSFLIGLFCVRMFLIVSFKYEVDMFIGKKGCVYGMGMIGLVGVGN